MVERRMQRIADRGLRRRSDGRLQACGTARARMLVADRQPIDGVFAAHCIVRWLDDCEQRPSDAARCELARRRGADSNAIIIGRTLPRCVSLGCSILTSRIA